MKPETKTFYAVLGISLLIQFLGALTTTLITDFGRTLGIWLIACMGYWICFAFVILLLKARRNLP